MLDALNPLNDFFNICKGGMTTVPVLWLQKQTLEIFFNLSSKGPMDCD